MRRGAGNGRPCQSGEDYIPTEHFQHPGRMGGRQYQTVFSKMTVRYWRSPVGLRLSGSRCVVINI